jgi:hypothetical protein
MGRPGGFNQPVFYVATIKGGIVLSRLSLPMLTAALLCPAFATQAQAPPQDFPEGPGRETFWRFAVVAMTLTARVPGTRRQGGTCS